MKHNRRRNDWISKEARRRGVSVKQLIQNMLQREDYYDIASSKRNNFAKSLIKKQEGGSIPEPIFKKEADDLNKKFERIKDINNQESWVNDWYNNKLLEFTPVITPIKYNKLKNNRAGEVNTYVVGDVRAPDGVTLNPNIVNNKTDYLHEKNHYYQNLYPQIFRNVNNTLNNKQVQNKKYNSSDFDYLIDPLEIHSRIMEYRYDKKIKPNQKLKKEDLDKDAIEKYHLNMFEEDDLLNILNNIVSNSTSNNNIAKQGGVIVDPMGQWNHPGQETLIPTEDGRITMKGVNYPVLGIDETGMKKMMQPGKNYKFRGKFVHEIPFLQEGGAVAKKQTRENPYINYKDVFSLALGERYPRKFPSSPNIVSENTAPSMSEMGMTPYQAMQNGGLFGGINSRFRKLIGEDLFSDDDDMVKENTAPSVSNFKSENEESELDESSIKRKAYALDLAMEDFSQKTYEDNPTFKTNSYINNRNIIPNLQNIDDNVELATQELLQKFPKLKITSGRRNWGDKDAHPVGRAVDLAGEGTDEAWKYYRDVIVPKYKFNPALNPNHGTGKHIHVGYYKEGGVYDLSMKDIIELKKKGFEFTVNK